MRFQAKVIAHSESLQGKSIITMQLCYPRFIHSELMTHRVFSRNAMSSRAIPVAKMIKQVRENPAMPVHWGKNQPGMQAAEELTGAELELMKKLWHEAAWGAAHVAEVMEAQGAHKQIVNRILEPFQWMHTIVTATEWTNFYALRRHPDAQPEFRQLANMMWEAQNKSHPVMRSASWHLPYISDKERAEYPEKLLIQVSAARCARVSYLKHDGSEPSIKEDIELFERLVGSRPLHASPIEHQAWPDEDPEYISNNFRGWSQFRQIYEVQLPFLVEAQ